MKRFLLLSAMFSILVVVQSKNEKETMFDVCQKTCNYKQPQCQCSVCCVSQGCDYGGKCRAKMCVCEQCPVTTTTTTPTTTTTAAG